MSAQPADPPAQPAGDVDLNSLPQGFAEDLVRAHRAPRATRSFLLLLRAQPLLGMATGAFALCAAAGHPTMTVAAVLTLLGGLAAKRVTDAVVRRHPMPGEAGWDDAVRAAAAAWEPTPEQVERAARERDPRDLLFAARVPVEVPVEGSAYGRVVELGHGTVADLANLTGLRLKLAAGLVRDDERAEVSAMAIEFLRVGERNHVLGRGLLDAATDVEDRDLPAWLRARVASTGASPWIVARQLRGVFRAVDDDLMHLEPAPRSPRWVPAPWSQARHLLLADAPASGRKATPPASTLLLENEFGAPFSMAVPFVLPLGRYAGLDADADKVRWETAPGEYRLLPAAAEPLLLALTARVRNRDMLVAEMTTAGADTSLLADLAAAGFVAVVGGYRQALPPLGRARLIADVTGVDASHPPDSTYRFLTIGGTRAPVGAPVADVLTAGDVPFAEAIAAAATTHGMSEAELAADVVTEVGWMMLPLGGVWLAAGD